MSMISDIVEEAALLLSKLPVSAIAVVIRLVKGALESDDPTRYLERRAEADAAHAASQEAVAEALRRGQ